MFNTCFSFQEYLLRRLLLVLMNTLGVLPLTRTPSSLMPPRQHKFSCFILVFSEMLLLLALIPWVSCQYAGQGLTSIPSPLDTTLTTLDISTNEITMVPTDAFQSMNVLTTLILENNVIDTIQSGAWNGLSALTTLLLAKNQMTSLNYHAFEQLVNLESLSLSDNLIDTIDSEAFYNLGNLKELKLQHNKLTIVTKVFEPLVGLEQLYLQNNDITSMTDDCFEGLPKLKEIWIYQNQMTTLNRNSLSPLRRPLTLGMSPGSSWACANMCWLRAEDLGGSVSFIYDGSDYTPVCTSGPGWSTLDPADSTTCTPPGLYGRTQVYLSASYRCCLTFVSNQASLSDLEE